MKKLDFDVFDLITPLKKPVEIVVDPPPPARPVTEAFRLAQAIKHSRFVLPQVELVGKQMTQGPSPVRHLQFGHYEIPDYALRKVINELEKSDRDAIRRYLWSEKHFEFDRATKKMLEFDAPFPDEAETAFRRVLHVLRHLEVMRPRQRRGVTDGGPAL